MLKTLIFFARFFLFWLVFFLIDRAVFVGNFWNSLPKGATLETAALAYHGIRLDLATAAYLISIPLLIFIFLFLKGKLHLSMWWLKILNKIYIIAFSIISIININIYREWGSKINAKAIGFAFSAPNEALASSASSPLLINFIMLGFLIITGLFLNRIILQDKIKFDRLPAWWIRVAFSLLLIALNFLLIRGGFGVSPNNQSMAYYSSHQLLNHAAVNTEWNLLADALKSRSSGKNPYTYFTDEAADTKVDSLYKVKLDTTVRILKTDRPNIVMVIMESFTADLTKTLGNEDGITPHFDSLIHKGVFFSGIYATGNRTDKGIIGSLAGFPSLAAQNIVKYPQKMERISALSREFGKVGYHNSFFYGGQSEFDNYKAFILTHDYQLLVDKSKFDARDMNSKWGAYDGVVFNTQLRHLNQEKQPFFSTQMTLTNHEPFEVPGNYKFGKADNVQRFKSTAFYTDSCLNDFLTKARQQPWYKNTLFIFVADHGHILPKGRPDVFIPQRYHIPLLFFGEVIKEEYRGLNQTQVGSQIDISSTLLHQLGLDATRFPWSKNLLNPYTKPFAFFSWDNGMGFMDNKQCVTFDNVGKMILYNDQPKDEQHTQELLENAKAYMQSVYAQFLSL